MKVVECMNMEPFHPYLPEYRRQLQKGAVKAAYTGLMQYFTQLRLRLKTLHPDFFISEVHFGLMDYTYLYFFPKKLQRQKLKVVILFSHETFKIEAWLAGYNKSAQAKYLKLFREKSWSKTKLPQSTQGVDYITTVTLTDNPDFSNPEVLTNLIEAGTVAFIKDIEEFIAKQG